MVIIIEKKNQPSLKAVQGSIRFSGLGSWGAGKFYSFRRDFNLSVLPAVTAFLAKLGKKTYFGITFLSCLLAHPIGVLPDLDSDRRGGRGKGLLRESW